ncbi:ATP-grasp domain-containing protein [Actinomadura sp. KC06]|uniref:ATP-grasp domain-containing protein n=1 Tax=Actinomadura sp. KC06 TaxID=2530369 RepID=UPI00104F1166|nr:ATP-grasp domain-containing protein [Actinomadura sp. KC06]TDD37545.1 ATP-grasp domain-containing protein [Actinomadura sp. KC06]
MERRDTPTLVVVEAQLTPEGILWPVVAAELDLATVFLTNDLQRYKKLPRSANVFGRDDVLVMTADTNSVSAVIETVRSISEFRDVRGIYTQCDYNLPLVAEAARELGLPGLSPHAAALARNKLFTREVCRDAGVPSPDFMQVTSAEQAVAFAEKVGFPCVVKPMTESASTDVALGRDPDEVARLFENIDAQRLDRRGQARLPGALVEEYCPGYEVSVETFTVDGQITVLGVVDKSVSAHPYFAEIGQVFPSLLPDPITAELAGTAVAGLRAIGHDFGAAHTEVRMTGNGPRLIEINARLAGEDIPELVDAALGLATRRQALAMHVGHRPDLTVTERRGAATRKISFPVAGTIRRVDGLDAARSAPGVVEVLLMVGEGDSVAALVSNHESYGQVRAEASSAGEALRLAEAAFNQISFLVD